MKRGSCLIIAMFAWLFSVHAQKDTLQARIILIGDAGDFRHGRHPVIDAVRSTVPIDGKTTILFLGDNLYSTGLPDVQSALYDIRRTVLDTQINIARDTKANVYFIPGNHDWDKSGPAGWDAVLRQQAYIQAKANDHIHFVPQDGCPGPVPIAIGKDAVLIIFDSQWWIHPYDKPGVESDCPYKTKAEFLSQLEDLLTQNSKKLVILACHHPFKSYGIHGGYFTLKQHIFPFTDLNRDLFLPLPLIGSIYPITRGVFGLPEDLSNPAYENMIRDVTKVARVHPNLVFVSGHEHNLQYIRDSLFSYIVSGSGTKSTRVSHNKNAPFTSPDNGFAVLNISTNKTVDVDFFTVTDSIRKAFSDHVLNFSKLPPLKFEDTIPIVYVPYAADSIKAAANPAYDRASKTKRFFNGDNYRDVWAAPIKLKVFRLKEEMGGFTVTGLGGGHQTRSLKLKDNKGREWSLRSINKDLTKILPPGVKGSIMQQYIQDFISTAHPYAPLIVPGLAKAVNVTVASPKIMFVPNDPALGTYRPFFANTVCLLEQKEPVPDGIDTKSEQKIVNKLYEDNDNRVDQKAFLRARLLDFLIADWDRHFDQWRFAEYDTGKGKLYIPIPRDRDQAFTYSDGLLVRLASGNFVPFLKGFRKDIPGIQWLAYWAKDLDRSFLNRLDAAEWKQTLAGFTGNLSDTVIGSAVQRMPREIYALDGAELRQKLISRRNHLPEAAMQYYRFLSRRVDVVGSNKNEFFKIESVGKNLQVRMYKRNSKSDSASLMYNRVFDPTITREVDIYGLNGDDFFEVDSMAASRIKLRIIGGRGNDTFNINGSVRNYLYDLTSEDNFIMHANRSHNRFANDPSVNRYSQTGYSYNRFSFPNVNLGYNGEDGLLAGIGFSRKVYNFRREPYSSLQRLSTLYAVSSKAYKITYNGEFNNVSGKKNDIVLNGEIGKPTLNNFFGLGNNTSFDKTNRGIEFYRVRYNYATLDALIRRRLKSYLSIAVGPSVYNYWNHLEDNADKILSKPALVGLDSLNVYKTKVYVGGKAQILLNNVNSELLPTRGINWLTQFNYLAGANANSRPVSSITSDMTVYSSLTDPARLVSILRVGGGHIFNNQYEYFQALTLGQNNFLRGFRKNRFAGQSLAYGSLTLLYKLFDSKSYIFPGSVGVIAFGDVGRVWAPDLSSKKWHHAFGGGLYYSPLNMIIISAAAGFSEEETLLNLSLGSKFNITF